MTEQMTSRERVLAAFRGEPCDRVPLISPVSLANIECMKLSRSYFPHANLNSIKMAALAETSYTVLKFDSIMPYFWIANEAGALGCNVDWGGSERMPAVNGSVLRSLDDFKMPQNYLDRRPIRTVINAVSLLKRRHQNQVAIIGKVLGPLSLVFYMYGIQNTLTSLILEPEKVMQLLDEVKDLCITFAQAQIEAGADVITVSEDAVGDLISRECYRRVVMQSEKRLYEALADQAYTIFHLSCDIMDRAELFAETGFHALSFDSRNDIGQLKKLTGDMKLIGSVNVPATLLSGKRESIANEAYYYLQNGVAMLAPECAITLRVSNENLMEMHEAILRYEKNKRRLG